MMKSILIFIVLAGCLCAADVQAIDKNYLLTGTSIGRAELGMPFRKFVSYFKYDSLDIQETGLSIFMKGKILLYVSDKNWGKVQIVRMATVYSDSYYTKEGIHVGTTIRQFLRIYPRQRLLYDGDFGPYFQSPSSDIAFNVTSFNKDSLLYREEDVDVDSNIRKYSRNGYIWSIDI